MLLRFDDLSTLEATLREGRVSPAAHRPTRARRLEDGSIWLEVSADPSGFDHAIPSAARLKTVSHAIRCWAELVPVVPGRLPEVDVAFLHLSKPAELPRLAGELRRLGCAGAGFLWYGRGKNSACVVRVPRPPAHLLSRHGSVVPFVQRAEHLWVEAGFDHPLCHVIAPRRGRQYLIPAGGPWLDVPTAPFRPLDARSSWVIKPAARLHSAARTVSVTVPARLQSGAERERPEYWVLPRPAVDDLHAFVTEADGRLVGELDFAVTPDGSVAIRARRSRTGPPVLPLGATAYVPLLKLPNVYLPAGARLKPPIRRDLLRERLCRMDCVTWLSPESRGRFTVTRIAADAFRPLDEWVEYLSPPATSRSIWRSVARIFVMEPFVGPQEVHRPADADRQQGKGTRTGEKGPTAPPLTVVRGTAPARPATDSTAEPDGLEVLPASEAVVRLHETEAKFLAIEGPLDAPERQALWPRLAELATAAGEDEDAGVCWANTLWGADSPIPARRWARAEGVGAAGPDGLPEGREPKLRELRAAAASMVEAASRSGRPVPADRLAAVGRLLAEYDHRLPVRAAWLAWVAVAKLSGGDALALTRARDRILGDLLENGLRWDRDFPTFLRGATTSGPAGRKAPVPLLRLREQAWDWCRGASGGPILRVFLDLTFAYALARYGDTNAARALMDDVGEPDGQAGRRPHRPNPDTVEPYQRWIWDAYRERVQRQIGGEPATAPLSGELRRRLAALQSEHGSTPGREQRQTADRFIQFSRILEPFDRVDPYRQVRGRDDLERTLAEIAAFAAPSRKQEKTTEQIELRLRELLKTRTNPHAVLRILSTAVPTSVRVGESFALDCVSNVRPALQRAGRWRDLTDLIDRVALLESAVGVAAHFNRVNLIGGLLGGLHELLNDVKGEIAAWLVAALEPGSFRFLSRLGLAEQAKTLLDRMTDAVTAGQPVGKLLTRPALNRSVVFPALLRLSGGWFYFGNDGPAREALAAARAELFEGSMSPDPRVRLAEAYAAALGHAPAGEALAGFTELFERLTVVSYEPQGSISRLRVVEAIALATASEDFAADARSRRWLDEDEFLIRRRIHQDVETALHAAGLR